jgi:hypothetical protein
VRRIEEGEGYSLPGDIERKIRPEIPGITG